MWAKPNARPFSTTATPSLTAEQRAVTVEIERAVEKFLRRDRKQRIGDHDAPVRFGPVGGKFEEPVGMVREHPAGCIAAAEHEDGQDRKRIAPGDASRKLTAKLERAIREQHDGCDRQHGQQRDEDRDLVAEVGDKQRKFFAVHEPVHADGTAAEQDRHLDPAPDARSERKRRVRGKRAAGCDRCRHGVKGSRRGLDEDGAGQVKPGSMALRRCQRVSISRAMVVAA